MSVHGLSGHEDALLHLLCRAVSLWFSLDRVNITMGRTRNREAHSPFKQSILRIRAQPGSAAAGTAINTING